MNSPELNQFLFYVPVHYLFPSYSLSVSVCLSFLHSLNSLSLFYRSLSLQHSFSLHPILSFSSDVFADLTYCWSLSLTLLICFYFVF